MTPKPVSIFCLTDMPFSFDLIDDICSTSRMNERRRYRMHLLRIQRDPCFRQEAPLLFMLCTGQVYACPVRVQPLYRRFSWFSLRDFGRCWVEDENIYKSVR